MSECDCAGRGCTGACEERHPPIVESMREAAKQLRRDAASIAKVRTHAASFITSADVSIYEKYEIYYSDVADYLEREIERAEKLHAELASQRKVREQADLLAAD